MDKDLVAFRKLRNNVNRQNNRLRSSFFEKKVNNCDDASSWWKSLKQLSGSSSKKSVSCVIEADKEINSTELANPINNTFLLLTIVFRHYLFGITIRTWKIRKKLH